MVLRNGAGGLGELRSLTVAIETLALVLLRQLLQLVRQGDESSPPRLGLTTKLTHVLVVLGC